MTFSSFVATFFLVLAALLPSGNGPEDSRPISDDAPRWFRGNLHTHSLWSDGNDYPEVIVDWYAQRGYHFLALSDHNTLSQGVRWINIETANQRAEQDGFARYRARFGDHWVETRTQENGTTQVRLKPLGEYRALFERPGQFLLIQSEEISDRFESKPIHLNATNLVEAIGPQGGSNVVDTMTRNLSAVEDQARRLGQSILTHLNHPNFGYAITAEELALVTKENFFEVYNGHPGVQHQGDPTHAGTERMWDIINTLRIAEMKVRPVYGLATDDSHNYFGTGGSSPGRGWIMVRSRFLTPESIIKAIEAGDFYASSGVTLKALEVDKDTGAISIEIETDGTDATYTTRFIGTREGYDATRRPIMGDDGSPLPVTQRYSEQVGEVLATVEGTRASYTTRGDELYIRAEITSSRASANPSFEGQRAQAWTQPVGWNLQIQPR